MKFNKKLWTLIILLLIFLVLGATYIAIQPGDDFLLEQYEEENQEILNP